jgi:hypothetical protein
MLLAELQTALSRLEGFDSGKGSVEDFIYLCARLCDCLVGDSVYETLRQRAQPFEAVTGPGSAFDSVRRELCQLSGVGDRFKTTPEEESSVWCPIIPQLALGDLRQLYGERLEPDVRRGSAADASGRPLLPVGAKNTSVLLRWWCAGEQTVHDAEWVRCNEWHVNFCNLLYW